METASVKPVRTLRDRIKAFERRLILTALERADGNQNRAAQALGVLPSTLCEKLKRLEIGVVRRVVDLKRADPGEPGLAVRAAGDA